MFWENCCGSSISCDNHTNIIFVSETEYPNYGFLEWWAGDGGHSSRISSGNVLIKIVVPNKLLYWRNIDLFQHISDHFN